MPTDPLMIRKWLIRVGHDPATLTPADFPAIVARMVDELFMTEGEATRLLAEARRGVA